MTPSTLKEYTLKDLAQMAKKRGICGWHSMRKDDLIRALVRDAKHVGKRQTGTASSSKSAKQPTRLAPRGPLVASPKLPSSRRNAAVDAGLAIPKVTPGVRQKPASVVSRKASEPMPSAVAKKIQIAKQRQERLKDLSGPAPRANFDPTSAEEARRACEQRRAEEEKRQSQQDRLGHTQGDRRDRVVLMVRDPYWLQVHWELSSGSIQRAQAAMAEHWHTAKPVIRLLEIPTKGTTSSTEMVVRDVEIHGGVNNWYIDVPDPPKGYRVEIGYVTATGRFHSIARSNSVMTPQPGISSSLDHNWLDVAENCERIFALSGGYSGEGSSDELQRVMEERLQRPVGPPAASRHGTASEPVPVGRDQDFLFSVDAEMIIHGTTRPDAHVTLGGEPIKLREDGTFSVRMNLPDRRQVLPMTSSSRDRSTQQTIVLAIERNTKVMEPLQSDSSANQ